MKSNNLLTAWMLGLVLTFLAGGCKDDDDPEVMNDIALSETSLGPVLTGKDGMTLYFFARDVSGEASCAGNCLTNWPVFSVSGTMKLGEGLAAADFGSIVRQDGMSQVTFKGWPLYYYANDTGKGDVNGENVGNLWYVARTDYTVMVASAQLIGGDGKSYKSDYTEGDEETRYFVDAGGRTLYTFRNDKKNDNNFTREDFSNDGTWPLFSGELLAAPSVLNKSLFAEIDVFGRKQLTYNGWPVYYFGADGEERGVQKGVSFPSPGVWPVLQPDTPEAPE